MLKNRIIPCLDVKNGRVVKGINFVDLKDAGDPVEQASIYDKGGADEICFLDITASNENRNTIIEVVSKTAEKCFVPLTVGGGIRTTENIRELLLAGADKVSINTAAVNDIKCTNKAVGVDECFMQDHTSTANCAKMAYSCACSYYWRYQNIFFYQHFPNCHAWLCRLNLADTYDGRSFRTHYFM